MADDPHDGIALLPSDDTGYRIRFLSTQEQKSGPKELTDPNALWSTSLEDQQQTVARSLRLGARHIDIGQRPEEGHVVLADPEGVDSDPRTDPEVALDRDMSVCSGAPTQLAGTGLMSRE
jgi:hypothetical protein